MKKENAITKQSSIWKGLGKDFHVILHALCREAKETPPNQPKLTTSYTRKGLDKK